MNARRDCSTNCGLGGGSWTRSNRSLLDSVGSPSPHTAIPQTQNPARFRMRFLVGTGVGVRVVQTIKSDG